MTLRTLVFPPKGGRVALALGKPPFACRHNTGAWLGTWMLSSQSVDLEAILQNRCVVILGCLWADGLGCGRKGAAKP